MNLILILLMILSFFNSTGNKQQPVRLEKKQEKQKVQIIQNKDFELIAIALFLTIIFVCLILLLVTSCTESGLIYNNFDKII